ncbi:MAG: Asp-tRNA(Asn)/Glu-tRNA(Gln) amidotransferase subunit GatB [Gammaproteobacteria bacterium]|nr:Asp-tRNA(Asn)/Glu-tRNA(Gln) amidotransferase subunit GatB [Gammaproteobacteria bacterium]NND39160.1 Asp-tRNA(Asn)/Glu-tRNA(Gln) amidotransferase subunit GatB [Pseudomonadales bacterium]NNM12537.1 Asp-tRNA(Asn)/Glu-tRNA(Gln) amidotransferase subunit GatB [Pseudomonadales bacterium]RZV53583.1 MAG: Asp-tRNA(Asn)/Glu-tRNA(Gln) amidotransferase subunit GatB [Pseudomonadales bacterium]
MQWETVIGLEVHVQLATKSKIFSGSSTAFGAPPNTQANAVDLALPGTLPVANEQAFHSAILFGLAVNAEIERRSVFERKNYFYPDLPKGYQTTQLAAPIVGEGSIEINTGTDNQTSRHIRIHHAHLEEDAGKSLHEDFHGMSGIDLNRAGTPLIEIVSEPDMRNAEEAVAYLKKIHAIVTYLGISDGDMSQGSLRCDANVSVRPMGSDTLGTRTETKNLNSFRFIEKAINVEVARQIDLIEDGGEVVQETRLYDSDKNETRSMRSKEEANDYRYFPCPDLLPVVIEQKTIESLRQKMPELPDQKRARFETQYELSGYDASLLCESRELADYFEQVAENCGDAKLAANWVMGELSAYLNKENLFISQSQVSAAALGQLISRIDDQTISGKIAKKVFESMCESGDEPDKIIAQQGLKQVSDSGAIEAMVQEVIDNSEAQVLQYLAAEPDKRKKLLGYFVGQVMKVSKGQANPGEVNRILAEKLK